MAANGHKLESIRKLGGGSVEWRYEKYDEDFNRTLCPNHDDNGSITGKVIINLRTWFDENPEERIRLGWIKHYYYSYDEVKKMYDQQTQFVEISTKMIDEFTLQDEIIVFDKTEDMLAHEELTGSSMSISFNFVF